MKETRQAPSSEQPTEEGGKLQELFPQKLKENLFLKSVGLDCHASCVNARHSLTVKKSKVHLPLLGDIYIPSTSFLQ